MLILLSVYVESKYLWITLIIAQFFFLGLHLMKMYDNFINYVMVLLWEIQIFFVIIYLSNLQFVD